MFIMVSPEKIACIYSCYWTALVVSNTKLRGLLTLYMTGWAHFCVISFAQMKQRHGHVVLLFAVEREVWPLFPNARKPGNFLHGKPRGGKM